MEGLEAEGAVGLALGARHEGAVLGTTEQQAGEVHGALRAPAEERPLDGALARLCREAARSGDDADEVSCDSHKALF